MEGHSDSGAEDTSDIKDLAAKPKDPATKSYRQTTLQGIAGIDGRATVTFAEKEEEVLPSWVTALKTRFRYLQSDKKIGSRTVYTMQCLACEDLVERNCKHANGKPAKCVPLRHTDASNFTRHLSVINNSRMKQSRLLDLDYTTS